MSFTTPSPAMVPSTESATLSLVIFGVGIADPSMKLRSCFSSALSTNWLSDSAVNSLIPFRCLDYMPVSISINNWILTTSFGLSKVPLSVHRLLNPVFSRTASNLITITGKGFGIFGHSAKAQTQDSNCPSSNWIGDSTIICRIPQASLQGGRAFSISVDHFYDYFDSSRRTKYCCIIFSRLLSTIGQSAIHVFDMHDQ